jgi:hypothetical protein
VVDSWNDVAANVFSGRGMHMLPEWMLLVRVTVRRL